jgi:hypothetical protein
MEVDMSKEIICVVDKIVEKGHRGGFVILKAPVDEGGVITVGLSPEKWENETVPETEGCVVVVRNNDIFRKRKFFEAKKARCYNVSDEERFSSQQKEKSGLRDLGGIR